MITGRNAKKIIKANHLELNDINEAIILDLKQNIKDNLEDPRQKHKTVYKLWDIVITVFLAVICNCNDWDDIAIFANSNYSFLRKYLKMTGGIPTAITYERVIGCLDKNALQSICLFFLTDIVNLKKKKMRDILNIDGKVDTSSSYTKYNPNTNEYENIKNLNVLNVYSNQLEMCIFSEMIEDKTNEITAFPTVINSLNIRNKIITVDALNTQKENCTFVKKKRGDFVFALKGNQGNFYNDVVLYFDEEKLRELMSDNCTYLKQIETRGKITIIYEYYQIDDVNWYFDYKSWNGLKTIGMVKKTISEPNKEDVIECRYYISSLDKNIELFSKCIRIHWSVENKLHWQLDYTFKCDDNTTVQKDALLGLQIIKKMALALLNNVREKEKISIKKLRLKISYNIEDELEHIFKILAK